MSGQSRLHDLIVAIGADIKALTKVRTTATYTTASIANLAEDTGTITMKKGYRLLRIQVDKASRVRVYTKAAARTADAARAIGTDPTGDHGLVLEYVASGAVNVGLSPTVDGFNDEAAPVNTIPIAIQNRSGATGTVTLTLTYIETES